MEIYKITNLINNKVYIGQTSTSMKQRMSEHLRHNLLPIDRALNKYGIENFEVEVIDEANSKEELNQKEIYYIKKYNCIRPNGYNLTIGGKATTGYRNTDEAKRKMSNTALENGLNKSEAYKGEGNPFFGKHHTEESKKMMSEKRKGMKHLTDEQVKKLRASHSTRQVICIETEEIFNSIKEASKKYNILETHITRVCKGKRKTCGGYHWKYYNS